MTVKSSSHSPVSETISEDNSPPKISLAIILFCVQIPHNLLRKVFSVSINCSRDSFCLCVHSTSPLLSALLPVVHMVVLYIIHQQCQFRFNIWSYCFHIYVQKNLCQTWYSTYSAHLMGLPYNKQSTYILSSFGRLCTCLAYVSYYIFYFVVFFACL